MRMVMMFSGGVSILIGALFVATPLPLGLPLFVLGCALLLTASPGLRQRFKRWRSRNVRVSDHLQKWEPRLPVWLRSAMEETRPDGRG
ncbi:MAG: hypothetical protein AB7F96_11815 [Beijerinckiaceae bacterium]